MGGAARLVVGYWPIHSAAVRLMKLLVFVLRAPVGLCKSACWAFGCGVDGPACIWILDLTSLRIGHHRGSRCSRGVVHLPGVSDTFVVAAGAGDSAVLATAYARTDPAL